MTPARTHDVLVVGAGPVGLFAAAAFAHAGVSVGIWDKRPRSAPLSRAIGVHAPALHALDRVGVTEPLLAEAVLVRRGHARLATRRFPPRPGAGEGSRAEHVATVDFAGVSRRFPFVATLPQHRTEALLSAAAPAVERGIEVIGIAPDRDGVTVRAIVGADPGDVREVRVGFVVIADGADSPTRRRLGVRSTSRSYRDHYLMADVADTTGDGDDAVVTLGLDGVVESFPLPGGVRRFVVHTPALLDTAGPDALARLVASRTGVSVDPDTATMTSAFGVRRSIAERFVVGTRVALVGDAAHEISPIGGQGMNLGWLDAAALVPTAIAALGGSDPSELERWAARRRRAAVAAARQAEANMAMSAPGTPADLRARAVALAAVTRGPSGRAIARRYAMGGDRGAV